jgi:hypothetical protein
MDVSKSDGQDLVYRLNHLAVEFRDLRRSELAMNALESLYFRLNSTLSLAVHKKLLPEPILNEVCANESSFVPSLSNFFWELALSNSVLGYSSSNFDVYTDPVEYNDEYMCSSGGGRIVFLSPGYIAKAWPNVFDSIYSGVLSDSDDPEQIALNLWQEKRFEIIGYYANSCELLAEWIENHGSDDNNERILPGDGLQCDDTVFVWDGKPYPSIGPTIAPLLRVLMKAYQHRRDATLPEFEAALGVRILDGFGRCFDVGKYPNKRKHEVWETIVGKRGKYRLIDTTEAK